jgi:hypothetical protein
MGRLGAAVGLFLLVGCVGGGVAWATLSEPEFKQHERAAHDAFVVGRYDDSLREYAAAFAVKPDPRVLYNLGLTHMKRFEVTNDRQDLVMGRQFFERFLALMPPSEPNYAQNRERNDKMRSLAEEFLSTIAVELDKRPPPKPAPSDEGFVPAAALQPSPPLPESHWRRYRTSYVLYGAAATVALGAVATGLWALLAQSNAEELRDAGNIDASLSKFERADRLALTTDILIGVAAVTAGVGAYLQYRQWRAERRAADTGPHMTLSLAPTSAAWTVHF